MFNRVGPVASIRVCRDAVTRRSLGYAYVNFHNVQDAERALDTMNFTDIKGRPCRIMWSQRDPSLRKSGVGNVFVKNLAPTVDNKGLFDTFSVFGNILSCKVATDENGASKGYGYVHYETAEAAQDAIQKFNGNFIDELEVYVGPFVKRQERATTVNWTNLYVKHFSPAWDEDRLKDIFGTYGALSSVFITRDPDGKSKGFGFVNYVEHEGADAAVRELNGKSFPNPEGEEGATLELYVNPAQKRGDRLRELKTKLDALKEDRASKFEGMNLYVKNIDDTVTDELFRETFAKFGNVTSARIMRDPADNTTSRGFGFVCFADAEEASRAAAELNNKLLRSKPITVTFHQRRDVRRAQLAATYATRSGRFPQGGAANMPMPYMPMYMPQGGQPNAYGQPDQPRPFGYQGQQQQQGSYAPRGVSSPRGIPFNGGRGGPAQGGYYPMNPQMSQNGMAGPGSAMVGGFGAKRVVPGQGLIPGQQQSMPLQGVGMQQRPRQVVPNGMMPPGAVPRGMVPPGRGYMGVPQQMVGMAPNGMMIGPGGVPTRIVPGVVPNAGIKFNSNVRNQGSLQQQQMIGMMPQQQQQQQQQSSVSNEPLDDQALAAADPQMQKNMIGERLYPLIYVSQPALAGKITGMLLEMDNAELLNLIESPEALHSKIDEALIVLKNHNAAMVGDQ